MPVSRLISPFLVTIERVDRTATALPPVGTPFASGYDDVFARPRSLPSGSQVGDSAHIYELEVQLLAQVEEFGNQKKLAQGVGGSNAIGRIELIFLRVDMEAIGWVTATGVVDLRPTDRLVRVNEKMSGKLVVEVLEAFGDHLYVVDAELDGWGGLQFDARSGLVDVKFATRDRTR